jgi:hypothetical protein
MENNKSKPSMNFKVFNLNLQELIGVFCTLNTLQYKKTEFGQTDNRQMTFELKACQSVQPKSNKKQ